VLGGAGFGVGVSGSVATALLTFLASLASLLWRKRKTIKDTVSGSASGGSRTVAVPNGLLQQLLVIASVAVLVLSWLVLFGVTTIGTATDLNLGHHRPSLLLAGLVVALVAFVGGFFDETSLSLHPFYRRRLASAFSTRAVTVPAERGGGTVAVPYHRRERTTLSTYARPAGGRREFPEFVFAAAANLTGEDRTPPGLTAVSFTMGADWVGGPDVGWVRTEDLEHLAPPRLKRDLTVQAAVAISGAAVASAMGRMSRWYQIVLALSGVRLGAWLPHPVFVDKMRQARDQQGKLTDWTLPGLPRVRRATYLLRELFNLHPYEERLLLVTDGGHYENLGIVEALRRRCTTIYCVDGGGDSPPTAPGLAQAMALAETELGVRIHLDRPFDSEPGGGQGLDPAAPLAALNAALSKSPVITGTFRYPAASGLPKRPRWTPVRRQGIAVAADALRASVVCRPAPCLPPRLHRGPVVRRRSVHRLHPAGPGVGQADSTGPRPLVGYPWAAPFPAREGFSSRGPNRRRVHHAAQLRPRRAVATMHQSTRRHPRERLRLGPTERTTTGDQRLPAAAELMVFASGSLTGHRSVTGHRSRYAVCSTSESWSWVPPLRG